MDSIILAGGYAKRMSPTTEEVPKHLLPIAGRPMLSYVLDSLQKLNPYKISHSSKKSKCYISINRKFEKDFDNFIQSFKTGFPLELVVEDTISEKQKLGSVGALNNVFNTTDVSTEPGTLVIGGDNLFSLDLNEFCEAFNNQGNYYKNNHFKVPSLFATYDLKDSEKSKLYGTVELLSLSAGGLNCPPAREITRFREKDANSKSTLASTAIYAFSNSEINRIGEYLSQSDGDAMGNFLEWILYHPLTVYSGQTDNLQPPRIFTLPFEGYWFDIGSHKSFEEANCFFRKN